MLDLTKTVKTDKEIIEAMFVPHVLAVALASIKKDGQGNSAGEGWIDMLGKASGVPIQGMPTTRAKKLVKEVSDITQAMFKHCGPATTYAELALSVSLLLVYLVKDYKFNDTTNQGVLISSLFVKEATDFGDMGSLKLCKQSSEVMRKQLTHLGYFL